MWLERFFQIIDNSFIGRYVSKKGDVISLTDPNRIYVENIRSFYNLKTPIAKLLCEMAVKDNLFKKCIGIECPNCGRIITYFDSKQDIPKHINCDVCQMLERPKYDFNAEEFKKITFYQLNVNLR